MSRKNISTIVIDCSLYFDQLYSKYLKYKQNIFDKKYKVYLINPVARAFDYILFSVTQLQKVIRKYRRIILYFNTTHRNPKIIEKSELQKQKFDRKLLNNFKRIITFMPDNELCGIYLDLHNYFKNSPVKYNFQEITDRKTRFDCDGELFINRIEFFKQLIISQNKLSSSELYFCNLLILSTINSEKVNIIYTTTPNIDFRRYGKFARFIRYSDWKIRRREESLTEPPKTISLFEYFSKARKLPIMELSDANSYEIFLNENPVKLYLFGENKYITENSLDEIISDLISSESNIMQNDILLNQFSVENNINFFRNVVENWKRFYEEFDLENLF